MLLRYYRKIRLDLRSGGGPLEHGDELFGEVWHGNERLEFGGDLLGSILRLAESLSERLDIRKGFEAQENGIVEGRRTRTHTRTRESLLNPEEEEGERDRRVRVCVRVRRGIPKESVHAVQEYLFGWGLTIKN